MTAAGADPAKQVIRERVWRLLEDAGAAERGVHGRIPAFTGADQAADRLAGLPCWHDARVVEVVPDRAQFQVRARALEHGKLVYMAVPNLAEARPFYRLDPADLTVEPIAAADRAVAARIAPLVSLDEMRHIDLIVCGSVAVNRSGARLGKGAGYSDIEAALLTDVGLMSDSTVIATTVHELQVIDDDLPERDHDFRVDLIITPERAIHCGPPKRPAGVDWTSLTPEKIAAIPALAARWAEDENATAGRCRQMR